MGTKENPSPFDAYAKAAPDEPMFTLLARDPHAPALVWLWGALRELSEKNDPEKIREARECCVQMMVWAKEHGKPSAGFGQAIMAGLLEMVRTINHMNRELGVPDINNRETEVDLVRRMMACINFGMDEDNAKFGAPGGPADQI